MALHAVIYRYSTDSAALDEHRPEHKDYLRSLFEQGHIVVSGPLADGGGPGALLILDAADPDEVEALLDQDPFHALGLIVEREVRRWNPALGGERLWPGTRMTSQPIAAA
jgi:uncharacterized protein